MAALSSDAKVFIVQALACFDTPTQVQEQVQLQFGVRVTLSQIAGYDPQNSSSVRLSKQLQDLFHETRKRFTEDISSLAIAHQAYRLRVLARTLEKVEKQGNTPMVAQLLEQAAKEVGGAFTNKQKHEHAGKDGTPLSVTVKQYVMAGPANPLQGIAGAGAAAAAPAANV